MVSIRTKWALDPLQLLIKQIFGLDSGGHLISSNLLNKGQ
jgi:hypothetical protein